jgi:hypothetical protein
MLAGRFIATSPTCPKLLSEQEDEGASRIVSDTVDLRAMIGGCRGCGLGLRSRKLCDQRTSTS